MRRTMAATFDGSVFKPDEKLDLEPDTVVRIIIETIPAARNGDVTAACLAANLDGSPDWSENLEEYPHGRQA